MQLCNFIWQVLGLLTLYGTIGFLVYIHFYFAFDNSLEEATDWTCWAKQNRDKTEPYLGEGKPKHTDEWHDVGDNFKVCARFGFYMYSFVALVMVLTPWFYKVSDDCGGVCMGIGLAVFGIMIATYMLMAMIYRWRHAGMVCAGDYLDDSYTSLLDFGGEDK